MRFLPIVLEDKLSKKKTVLHYAVESKEGYIILQCRENDIPTGRILAFYGRTRNFEYTTVLGGFNNSADAKKACEKDFLERLPK